MANVNEMLNLIAPLVVKYAKQYGYHVPSAIIAQSMHETGCWTDGLSPYNNFFGLKCGGAWKGKRVNKRTWEVYEGKKTNINDDFRVYDSVEEGVEGYFKFLNWSRYRNLSSAHDPWTYLQLIHQDGYATDPNYVQLCYNYVLKYDLTKYDGSNSDSTPVAKPTEPVKPEEPKIDNKKPSYKIGKTYTTQVNLYVRDNPTTSARKKLMSEVSANAKLHSYADTAGACILKKGTKVTCLGIAMKGKDIWLRIPSGYVAAYYQEAVYVK